MKYGGKEISVDILPKIKIELVVPDKDCEKVIQTIVDEAKTGQLEMEEYLSLMWRMLTGFELAKKEIKSFEHLKVVIMFVLFLINILYGYCNTMLL